MRRQNPSRICSRNGLALADPSRHRPAAKGGRIDGSNRCILKVDRDCVARIPRPYAVEMALPFPRPQAGWPNAERREQREEGRQQRAASSIHCIFTVSRDHVEKCTKVLSLSFAKSLKSRGCFEEARQLHSLHIYGVSWPRR